MYIKLCASRNTDDLRTIMYEMQTYMYNVHVHFNFLYITICTCAWLYKFEMYMYNVPCVQHCDFVKDFLGTQLPNAMKALNIIMIMSMMWF